MDSDIQVDTTAQGAALGTPRVGGSRTRKGMLIGAIGLVMLLVGVGLAVAGGDDDENQVEISAGTNLAVTADAEDIVAHNSPAIATDPTDPATIVVAARVDRPQLSAALHRSDDGGRSWSHLDLPLPPGEVRAFGPDVAFDRQGRLHVVFLTLSDPANNPTGVWLARADERGGLGTPVKVTGPYAYQARLALNPAGGTVHVSFVQASSAVETVRNGFGTPPNPVMVATSTDGGSTFGAPVTVSPDARQRVGAVTPLVAPKDGRLYVLYQDFGDDSADFEGRPGRPIHDGRFSLVVARSDDGGSTFEEAGVVDGNVVPTERFNPYYPKSPSLAADPTAGTLYVAWADGKPDDTDVFVRRSTDGGVRWGPRVRIPAARQASGSRQELPAVSVAPGGRVDVGFLDRSAHADGLFAAAAVATSFDGGRTWQTVVVSDKLFDPRVGPESPEPGTADLGSRIAVVSRRTSILTAWSDSRSGTADTGRQDIYFAPVRIAPE